MADESRNMNTEENIISTSGAPLSHIASTSSNLDVESSSSSSVSVNENASSASIITVNASNVASVATVTATAAVTENRDDSTGNTSTIRIDDDLDTESDEPPRKKTAICLPSTSSATKINSIFKGKPIEKLEARLEEILCCAVCLDLPKMAMYQCQMGHLMCAACFSHLLADGRLRNITLTCPNCRVETSKATVTRNRAVEKIANELPSPCQFCSNEFPYKYLECHEKYDCSERLTKCKYVRIGCNWQGPYSKSENHATSCTYPNKTGAELMPTLKAYDEQLREERRVYHNLFEILSTEKIVINDLKMESVRLYANNHKLSYETNPFSAFDQKWVVKARINNNQREPHQCNDRAITYQLVLWTEPSTPMSITFCALKGPFSDLKIKPHFYKHDFTERFMESTYNVLPLPDSSECNRLLSDEVFNFRLLMVMTNK